MSRAVRLALNTASSPPTQMASFPEAAPLGPPLTGASRQCRSRAAKTSWMWRTMVGELVERSNSTVPGAMPAIRPSVSSSATASTSDGPGRDVMITSEAAASSRGVSAHLAPAARCVSALSRRMSCTVISAPALIRLVAKCVPMVPRPINPIFFICMVLDFYLQMAPSRFG